MLVDVAVLTALDEERKAVVKALTAQAKQLVQYDAHKSRQYEIYSLDVDGDDPLIVAVPTHSWAGPLRAAVAASEMLRDISPRLTILCGIAGCMEAEQPNISLGDVAIGREVIDIMLGKHQEHEMEYDIRIYDCPGELIRAAENWRNKATHWYDRIAEPRPDGIPKHPIIHTGAVISGSYVLADRSKKDEIREKISKKKIIAIEMEAAGIASILKSDQDHDGFIVIKSYSDWATEHDKGDRATGKDRWHKYAYAVAAECTVAVLKECFGKIIRKYRSHPAPIQVYKTRINEAAKCLIESYPAAAPFFREVVRELDEARAEETENLLLASLQPQDRRAKPRQYFAEISSGAQFLVRAKPLFRSASVITAFSVDKVSSFWLASPMKSMVKKYVDFQTGKFDGVEKKVMRTFVFSTPEEAHAYARRLDYHAQRCAQTFIISADHYRRMLRTVAMGDIDAVNRWSERDFSILEFKVDGSLPVGRYFADLEGENLKMEYVVPGDVVGGLHVDKVQHMCRNWVESCEAGSIARDIEGIVVLRWTPLLWQDRDSWEQALSRMFGDRAFSDMIHMTGIGESEGEEHATLRRELARYRKEIQFGESDGESASIAQRFNIKSVDLLQWAAHGERRPVEGITKGRLHYVRNGPLGDVVSFRFGDRQSLEGFLADPAHTELRMGIIRRLAKSNEKLDSLMKEYGISNASDLRERGSKVKYERLENTAKLWRLDFSVKSLIKEVVGLAPLPF